MRKIICIMLMMSILVCGAIAEGSLNVDVKAMDTDELLLLSDGIDAELTERGYFPSLPIGQYLVGRDIAAGRYMVQEHSNEEDWYRAWSILVYKTLESIAEYDAACIEYYAAYDKAEKDEENGNEPIYPSKVVDSNYYSTYDLSSGASMAFTLNEGEVMMVKKVYAEDAYLTISEFPSLFMD